MGPRCAVVVLCGAKLGFEIPDGFFSGLSCAFSFTTFDAQDCEPAMWYRFNGDDDDGWFVRHDPLRSDEPEYIGRTLTELVDDIHLTVALHSTEHVFVHSGVIEWQGKAILIPGRSHSGKSTLVHALVRRGATYFSDEYALIDKNGFISPYPRPIQIRSETGRKLVDPHAIGSVGVKPVEPGLILFTTYDATAVFDPQPMSASTAALGLFDNTIVAQVQPNAATSAAAHVARLAEAMKSSRGDADSTAEAVLQLVRHGR